MPSPRLSGCTKWSYGIGEMGVVAPVSVSAFFLLFFFTEVVGLSPGQAGSILLLGRLWDAINDPFVGYIADRTRTSWGSFRPYLVWMCVPFAITGIFIFDLTSRMVWYSASPRYLSSRVRP